MNKAPFRTKKERQASRDLRALETNLLNRLYYNDSNVLKINEPLSPKNNISRNNLKILNDLEEDENYHAKNISSNEKKFDYSNFNEYLDKLVNYESRRVIIKK